MLDPESMSGWTVRAVARWENGDPEGATADLQSIMDGPDPLRGQHAALLLGWLLAGSDQPAQARDALVVAASGPDRDVAARAEVLTGLVLVLLDDTVGAMVAWRRALDSGVAEIAGLFGDLDLDPVAIDEWLAEDLRFGDVLVSSGAGREAEPVLRRLLDLRDPEYGTRAALVLHQLYTERSEYHAAKRVAERAIALGHPALIGVVWLSLGESHLQLGDATGAAHAFRRAGQYPETAVAALFGRGQAEVLAGELDSARDTYRQAIEADVLPWSAEAALALAQLHRRAGEPREAITTLDALLSIDDPALAPRAAGVLAAVLHDAGDPDGAEAVLSDILRRYGPEGRARAYLAWHKLRMNEEPTDSVLGEVMDRTDHGLALARQGDVAGARAAFHQSAQSPVVSEAARAVMALAILEVGQRDADAARAALVRAASGEDPPSSLQAALLLGLLDEPEGVQHPMLQAFAQHQTHANWDRAQPVYLMALTQSQGSGAQLAEVLQAQVELSRFDFTAAEVRLRKAIASGHPLASAAGAYLLSMVLEQRGEDECEVLRAALPTAHPSLAGWLALRLGTRLVDRDDLAAARDVLQLAVASGHSGVYPAAVGTLCELLVNQQDIPAVRQLQEQVIAHGHPVLASRFAFALGMLLVHDDDPDAALDAFDRVPPDHAELGTCAVFAAALLRRQFASASTALARLAELGEDDLRFDHVSTLAIDLAHCFQQRGDTSAADATLSLTAQLGHPASRARAGVFLGSLRIDAGDRDGALQAWETAAEVDDSTIAGQAAFDAGVLREERGERDRVEAWLRRAAAIGDNPVRAAAWNNLGELYADRGDLAAARDAYERAIESGPADIAAHAADNLGHRLEQAGDAEADAAFELISSLLADGDFDQAVAGLERMVRLDDPVSSATAALNLGLLQQERGDFTAASSAYQSAIDGDHEPIALQACFQLGYLRYTAGDPSGAVTPWARGAKFDGDVAHACAQNVVVVAGEQCEAGDHGAAADSLRALAGTPYGDAAGDLAYDFAKTCETANDLSGAVAYLSAASDLLTGERRSMARMMLVSVLAQAGDHEASWPILVELAADPDPKVAINAATLLGMMQHLAGDGAALDTLRAAAAGGEPIVRYLLAQQLRQAGDLTGAVAEYEALAESGGEYAGQAMLSRGVIAHDGGDDDTAGQWWLRAVQSDDPSAVRSASANLGLIAKRRRDLPEALRWYGPIADAGQDDAALAAAHLGELCYWLEDFDGALRWYERTLAGTEDPELVGEAAYRAAEILAGRGDPAGALTQLRRAIDSGDPAFGPQASALLAKLT